MSSDRLVVRQGNSEHKEKQQHQKEPQQQQLPQLQVPSAEAEVTSKPADMPSPAAHTDLASASAAPKLSRKSTARSAVARDPILYLDLPDVTEGAVAAFQCIPDCLYGSKNIGLVENDALDCDCRDDWGAKLLEGVPLFL